MKKLFAICLILFSSQLFAGNLELSFLDLQRVSNDLNQRDPAKVLPIELKDYNYRDVAIRGYLFEAPSGDWILAGKPDLKSCCIGSEKHVFNQIYVDCVKDPTYHNQLVVADGRFHVEVLKNEEGKFVRVYSLKEAAVQRVNHRKIPIFTLSSIALLAALFYVKKRGKK